MPRPPFRSAIAALVSALLAGPAPADVQRPLDERATGRLVAEAIAEANPRLKVTFGATQATLTATRPDGRSHAFRLDEIHAQLRTAPNGATRSTLLDDYVARELAIMDELASGKAATGLQVMNAFDPETLLPILRPANSDASWQIPEASHLGFAGGLFILWIQDRTLQVGSFRMTPAPLSAHEARSLNLDRLDLQRLGLANLERRLDRVTQAWDGRFLTLSLDGRFGSSLMLLPRYWQAMAQDAQVLTAAIPQDDALIVIANANPAELSELRQRITRSADAAGVRPLSTDLFRWTGSEWQVLPP